MSKEDAKVIYVFDTKSMRAVLVCDEEAMALNRNYRRCSINNVRCKPETFSDVT